MTRRNASDALDLALEPINDWEGNRGKGDEDLALEQLIVDRTLNSVT